MVDHNYTRFTVRNSTRILVGADRNAGASIGAMKGSTKILIGSSLLASSVVTGALVAARSAETSLLVSALAFLFLSIYRPVLGLIALLALPAMLGLTVSLTLRQSGLVIGGVIFLMVYAQVVRISKTNTALSLFPFETSMIAMIGINLVAAFNGLLRANDPAYLVFDAGQVLVIPLVFLLTLLTVRKMHQLKLVFYMSLFALFLTVLRDLFFTLLLGAVHSPNINSALLFPFLLSMVRDSKTPRRRIVLGSVLLLNTIHLLTTLTRTYWLGAAFALLLYLALTLHEGRKIKTRVVLRWVRYLFLITLLLLCFLGMLDFLDFPLGKVPLVSMVLHRISMTYRAGVIDRSIQGRLVEAKAAFERALGSPLIGWGHGATFENPRILIPGAEFTPSPHFIHNSYVAIFFRMGVVGLLILLWMALSFLYHGYITLVKMENGTEKTILRGILIAHMQLLLMSLFAWYYIGNVYLGTWLGLQGAILRLQRQKSQW